MDSLTHVVLGAAIGEGVLGKQAGKKAMLWGALAATAPDLDVAAGLFLNDIDNVIFHRGITHSFFFILLSSPLYGWLISRIHRKSDVHFRQWTLLVFLAQLTHALLDSFTSYGTQLLLPFSNEAVALSTISVIDPLFTLPLIVAVIWLLIRPADYPGRAKISFIAILISCGYLSLTVANKIHTERQFTANLEEQHIRASLSDVKPTLLNNLLWRGIFREDGTDTYQVGYYSLADGQRHIPFERIEGNHALIEPYREFRSVRRLLWVSQGFYKIEQTENGYIFNDLRFGRVAEFADHEDSPYAFSYKLTPIPGQDDFEVERIRLRVDRERESGSLRDLRNRIFGRE